MQQSAFIIILLCFYTITPGPGKAVNSIPPRSFKLFSAILDYFDLLDNVSCICSSVRADVISWAIWNSNMWLHLPTKKNLLRNCLQYEKKKKNNSIHLKINAIGGRWYLKALTSQNKPGCWCFAAQLTTYVWRSIFHGFVLDLSCHPL